MIVPTTVTPRTNFSSLLIKLLEHEHTNPYKFKKLSNIEHLAKINQPMHLLKAQSMNNLIKSSLLNR